MAREVWQEQVEETLPPDLEHRCTAATVGLQAGPQIYVCQTCHNEVSLEKVGWILSKARAAYRCGVCESKVVILWMGVWALADR